MRSLECMTHSTLLALHLSRAALLLLATLPGVGFAQAPQTPAGLVSVDPYGLTNHRLTMDAEFCGGELSGTPLACALTAGLSGSIERHTRPPSSRAARHHADLDGFFRFRSHQSLTGWWLGLRTGVTYADRHGIRPGVGAEAGLSWLINRRFYAGASVGARKVFLLNHDVGLDLNPSVRFAAGFAF